MCHLYTSLVVCVRALGQKGAVDSLRHIHWFHYYHSSNISPFSQPVVFCTRKALVCVRSVDGAMITLRLHEVLNPVFVGLLGYPFFDSAWLLVNVF